MKGPGSRFERREAPIRCGFARTYEQGFEVARAARPSSPGGRSMPRASARPTIKHPSRPWFQGLFPAVVSRRPVARGALEDVVLGDLDAVQREGVEHLLRG